MEEVVIEAQKREITGKQVRALRRENKLPAVIYGHRLSPIVISLNARDASRILSGMTSSQLITVQVEGDSHVTLVREKQRHPVTGHLLHVDFLAVSMTEKLKVNVPIEFRGEAPAVKDFGGILVPGVEGLEIESLPQDLPERLVIDVSVLKQIGDALHVRDIPVSDKIQVLTAMDEVVAIVTAPAAEEEVAPAVEVVAGEEPEVIEKGKKEEEAAEE
ncbi:MAG: 50S ribosomal protein L25 [Anaerolineales bacterium]|nr:50S ribosomal protein L25 [Anaerolineales bacterium]